MQNDWVKPPKEPVPAESDQILDYLFLGNLNFAKELPLLQKQKITHILNLTRHGLPKEVMDNVQVTAIILKDKSGQNIVDHFPTAFAAIALAKKANGRIFIHCKAGVSRSVAITLAYLMTVYKWSLNKSWYHVKKHRAVLHPNRGFLQQLCQYEKQVYPQIKQPSLNLHDEVWFTIFERMEELHGGSLMDYMKARPQTQYESEALAKQGHRDAHGGEENNNHCYDAGIGGRMHLHKMAVYTRDDLIWLDVVIHKYLTSLQNAGK